MGDSGRFELRVEKDDISDDKQRTVMQKNVDQHESPRSTLHEGYAGEVLCRSRIEPDSSLTRKSHDVRRATCLPS